MLRRAILGVMVLALHGAAGRAQQETSGAVTPEPLRICVRADDATGLDEVVRALTARGVAAVPCGPTTGDAWVVDVRGLTGGELDLTLRSPGRLAWRPEVDLDGASDVEARARAAAISATSVLRLILETQPTTVGETPGEAPDAVSAASATEPVGGTAVSNVERPAVPVPAATVQGGAPSDWRWALGTVFGTEGDLGGSASRRHLAFDAGLRAEVTHAQGVWLAVQFDWTLATAERAERLLLETGTPRLLVGGALGTDVWAVRLGLGGAFQGWWTVGGGAPSGWRMGLTGVISFAWHPLPWLAAGVDAGLDLYRTRVEIDYADSPVFELDHWRWRAGAWVAWTFDAG